MASILLAVHVSLSLNIGIFVNKAFTIKIDLVIILERSNYLYINNLVWDSIFCVRYRVV